MNLAEKIAQLEAEFINLQGARLANESAAEEQEAYEAMARKVADEKALQECIKKYGKIGKEIHAIYTDSGICIVRRASLEVYRDFQKRTAEDRSQGINAAEQLVRDCLVHPKLEAYAEIERLYPMTTIHLAGAIGLLAGAVLEEAGKVLPAASGPAMKMMGKQPATS